VRRVRGGVDVEMRLEGWAWYLLVGLGRRRLVVVVLDYGIMCVFLGSGQVNVSRIWKAAFTACIQATKFKFNPL
jgi:hypothetical protein